MPRRGFRQSLRTIRAILRREFIDVLRDPRSLALTMLWPISMLVMYGYGIRYDVDNVPITILDYSETTESRDLAEQMLRSKYFSVVRFARDQREVDRDLMNDAIRAAIVIPRDFADKLRNDESTAVQVTVFTPTGNTLPEAGAA